jgi:hypothetical protein
MKNTFIVNMVNFALKRVVKALSEGVAMGKFIVVDTSRLSSFNKDNSALTLDESMYQPVILNGFRANTTR